MAALTASLTAAISASVSLAGSVTGTTALGLVNGLPSAIVGLTGMVRVSGSLPSSKCVTVTLSPFARSVVTGTDQLPSGLTRLDTRLPSGKVTVMVAPGVPVPETVVSSESNGLTTGVAVVAFCSTRLAAGMVSLEPSA